MVRQLNGLYMQLDTSWRILTVGDGDLSFSNSLVQDHNIRHLVASVYDSRQQVLQKYPNNGIDALTEAGIKLLFEFDVMALTTAQSNSTQYQFDLVIFQFPLIPHNQDIAQHQQQQQVGDSNLHHRILLHTFLRQCANTWLSPQGAKLALITSKAVKPYDDWDLEGAISSGTGMRCVGAVDFDSQQYPSYQPRNVNRDKWVKDTAALTYVFQHKDGISDQTVGSVRPLPRQLAEHCPLCGVGPIKVKKDWQAHEQSRRHQRMLKYEMAWRSYLEQQGLDGTRALTPLAFDLQKELHR